MGANPQPRPERVQVVEGPPDGRWQPRVGAEALELLGQLRGVAEGQERVRDEAIAILRSCVPPEHAEGSDTGLVVGHVQSGKTTSFTMLTALARDNSFPLVIVITGTSTLLSGQSLERLKQDLRLDTRPDRRWQQFENPRGHQARHTIADTLADWRDPEVPDAERQTVLIMVMKQYQHLRHLGELLRALDLRQVSALVIDDEADQASLNNLVNQQRESTTYRRLLELRRLLPHHTYVQYTATPQAPLLINLIDVLSPRFAQVLTPGEDYVGGRVFFVEQPELVRVIPGAEIPTRANPLSEPPPTLLEAMKVFLLGVAAGQHLEAGRGNRSMMVHPSQQTLQHAEYARWVREAKEQWEDLLSRADDDPDRQDFVEELQRAYDDLRGTVATLPALPELLGVLRRAIRRIQVTEVNAVSGRTPVIDWRAAYGHILVGGQAMDRGFTVKGLTVTYMPRGVGVRSADTIQQRARFFGYKRPYLGYCRVYLEVAVRNAYRQYVEHEEDIRARLIAHRGPLVEWKRAFFLDGALEPTRRSVLDLDYMQGVLASQWYASLAPHDSEDAIASNRQVVDGFLAQLALHPAPGHADRTDAQRHDAAEGVPLQLAFTELLTRLRITRAVESQQFTGLLLQIAEYLRAQPNALCHVYRMSPAVRRRRGLNDSDEIANLFQGAYPVMPEQRRGTIYPGDQQVKAPHGMTIQIHRLDLEREGNVVHADVPTIGVWVPAEMARRGWLVQEEPR